MEHEWLLAVLEVLVQLVDQDSLESVKLVPVATQGLNHFTQLLTLEVVLILLVPYKRTTDCEGIVRLALPGIRSFIIFMSRGGSNLGCLLLRRFLHSGRTGGLLSSFRLFLGRCGYQRG